MKESKSVRYDVKLKKNHDHEIVTAAIKSAAEHLGLYISHIGSFSRKKYPNSIHWHFKEHPNEIGCLDATFWKEGNEFWIVARNREPNWVKQKAKSMQTFLSKKL